MTATLQQAVDALTRLGCKPTKSGDSYVAYCPIHEADGKSHKQSLTLKAGNTVPVVVNCHAGCDGKGILKTLGINGTPNKSASIVATYRYQTAEGVDVREKVRHEPKDFRIRHRDTAGNWVYKAGDGPAVLYRLPELRTAIAEGRTVFVVEGEKDADRLASLGLVATCNIEGAAQPNQRAKWRNEYTTQLAGASRVVLVPDNDAPGRAHMQHIATQLAEKVADVRWLELPGLQEKGDVSDWLNAGRTADNLKELVAEAPESNAKPVTAGVELKTKRGEVVSSFGNAVRLLQAAEFGKRIAFNEFAGRIQRIGTTPWANGVGDWTDNDTSELMLWAAERHSVDFSSDTTERAIALVANRNKFNPAQDRLRELAELWDGKPRNQSWLSDYLEVTADDSNREYLAEIGANWLKGVTARVLLPGCKRDDVLVLVGVQGFGKSTAAAAIADAICQNSFTDSLGNLGTEEAANGIRGITIAEFSELSAVARSDLEATKAFVSRSSDRFREKYARHPADHPRTCSFIASTNEDCGFLRDPSGNRRWWPVTICRPIDTPRLKEALPQLLGEAAHRVLAGETWHVTNSIALSQAEEIREDNSERDVWESAVLHAMDTLLAQERTISKVLDFIGIKVERQDRQATNRVSAILRMNGWTRKRGRVSGGGLGYIWICSPHRHIGEQEGNMSLASHQADCSPVPICSPQEKNKLAVVDDVSGEGSNSSVRVPGKFNGNRGEQGEQGEQRQKQEIDKISEYQLNTESSPSSDAVPLKENNKFTHPAPDSTGQPPPFSGSKGGPVISQHAANQDGRNWGDF